MKRIVSILLAVCIMLSLSVGVFAATMTPSVSSPTVKAGDEVTVALTLDNDLENVMSLEYKLYFDAELFEMTASQITGGSLSILRTDATGSYYQVQFVAIGTDYMTIPKNVGTVTFKAKSDVTAEKAASFRLAFSTGMLGDFSTPTCDAGPAATVTVTPASTEPEGYTISASATPTATTVDGTVQVSLDINKAYNAYQVELSYDSACLSYVDGSFNGGEFATVNANTAGKLILAGFGTDRTAPLTLNFKATKATDSAKVTIDSAKIDEKGNATAQDAPDATILTAAADIKIANKTHQVDLDKIFTGDSTVEDGKDYTFSKAADGEYYDYEKPTAKMDGKDVEVIENADGTYTVKNVTGDLTITGKRTPKTYNVTIEGTNKANTTGAANATYLTDYTFTVSNVNEAKYDYEIKATIGGKEVTVSKTLNNGAYTCTIAGADIKGDITITSNATEKSGYYVQVIFDGNGKDDATGADKAEPGVDYTFTVDEKTGYTYEITAKNSDGTALAVIKTGNGAYKIAGASIVSGKNITITVTKTATRTVEVYEYVKMDGKTVFLVLVSGTGPANGNAITYDGNAMFQSANYNAYAYLVIGTESLDEMKEIAKTKIGEAAGTNQTVIKTTDVNKTGVSDINDAQLVWNMYNAEYSDFATCTMEMFLRADQDANKELNVQDARAIISAVTGG